MTHTQGDAKTSPHDEFPRWNLRRSGIGRYWATRRDQPTTAEIKAGAKLLLAGDTPDELADRLRDEEELLGGISS